MARMYGARTASRAYRDRARQRRRTAVRGSIKWLCYAVVAVFLCVMEGTFFAFFGASVTAGGCPYLLPAWMAAVAMYEGAVGGAWFGIVIGLFASAAGGDALYVLPLLYMCYGLLVGLLGRYLLRQGFLFYAVYETMVCALHGVLLFVISAVSAMIAGESLGAVIGLLWASALADGIASVLWSLPLYLPLLLIRRLTCGSRNSEESLSA